MGASPPKVWLKYKSASKKMNRWADDDLILLVLSKNVKLLKESMEL
jgi:hypothetical protein